MHWHKVCALQQLGTYLLQRGCPPGAILQKFGLPVSLLLNPDAWLERGLSLSLAQHVSRIIGDPWAGLHAAEALRLEDLGPWGLGVLQASTLRTALDFAAAHMGLLQSGTVLSVVVLADGRACVSMGYEGALEDDPTQHQLVNLLLLRKLVDLTGESVPAEVALTHERHGSVDELERLLGPRLAFGQDQIGLTLDAEALSLPLRQPSAPESRGGPDTSARAVFLALRQIIQTGRPTLNAVAGSLSMNPRTLQRHLGVLGTTFEELLDDYRMSHALADLVNSGLSFTEICFRLGYSDSAHFTRAVRRWTGRSPRQVRQQLVTMPNWRYDVGWGVPRSPRARSRSAK